MSDPYVVNGDSAMASAGGRFLPLRIWPAVGLLAGMVLARLAPTLVDDGPAMLWMIPAFGPLLCSLLILIWWLAASRANWRERLLGFIGVVVIAIVTILLLEKSMIGPAITVVTIPVGVAMFALGGILSSRTLSAKRTMVAILFAIFGFGFSTLLRAEGMWGNFAMGIRWRWQPTGEEQLLASKASRPPSAKVELSTEDFDRAINKPEWPEFRGADRSGRQHGVKFSSNWSSSPPELLWKIPVGPAWSSFVVAGNYLFTQEQRGVNEAVVCYDAKDGTELWVQQVEARFDDPLGGPGPRATPTLANGHLYAMGAQGFLLRLNPRSGEVVWKKDLRKVADRDPPMWGFSSSPLVVDSLVVVHAGGKGDKGLLAFDVETGDLRWSVAIGEGSYSSPQLIRINDESLLAIISDTGLILMDPKTGHERLNYDWKILGYRALQPQVVSDDSILLPTGMGSGTRRIRITKTGDALTTEDLWTSRNLKPDFNDFVVYRDFIYGFDAAIFTCISLETGERKWKGGRYGKGQVLLLEDSGLLLVVTEQGDIVLAKADPASHQELGQVKAIEGKTWNHPVVVGDRLYVRNSQEAACFRLPVEKTLE